MKTDTKKLLIHGLELAGKTFAKATQTMGWSPSELDELVLHQVSKVHTEQLCAMLGLDVEKRSRSIRRMAMSVLHRFLLYYPKRLKPGESRKATALASSESAVD